MKRFTILTLLTVSLSLITSIASAQMGGSQMDLEIHSRIAFDRGSDASIKTIGFNKSLFNIKLKEGQKGVISTSFNYAYAHLNYNIEDLNYNFKEIEDFHSLGINISYFKMMNQKWSFIGILNPQLSSNFAGKLKGDDLYINAIVIFNYSRKRSNRLSFGLVYSNTMGVPFPIPIISYWKKFDDKWEMNLGFPRMSIAYSLNPKSLFTAYTAFDGYNLNISESIQNPLSSHRRAQKINYIDIISGMEYAYQAEKFQFRFNFGYTIYRYFGLQNDKHETAYKFDMANNLNLGIGFGFKF